MEETKKAKERDKEQVEMNQQMCSVESTLVCFKLCGPVDLCILLLGLETPKPTFFQLDQFVYAATCAHCLKHPKHLGQVLLSNRNSCGCFFFLLLTVALLLTLWLMLNVTVVRNNNELLTKWWRSLEQSLFQLSASVFNHRSHLVLSNCRVINSYLSCCIYLSISVAVSLLLSPLSLILSRALVVW